MGRWIGKPTLARVLAHDPHCQYCGKQLVRGEARKHYRNVATVDHLRPRVRWRPEKATVEKREFERDLKNLVLACSVCNRRKGKLTLHKFFKRFGISKDPGEIRTLHDMLQQLDAQASPALPDPRPSPPPPAKRRRRPAEPIRRLAQRASVRMSPGAFVTSRKSWTLIYVPYIFSSCLGPP